MHAQFFNDQTLLECKWLGNMAFREGQHEKKWYDMLEGYQHMWSKILEKVRDKENTFEIDPSIEAVITAIIEKTKWEDAVKMLNMPNFTLVHADLWPNQILWNEQKATLNIIDWEAP